jgi:hypothetical protein
MSRWSTAPCSTHDDPDVHVRTAPFAATICRISRRAGEGAP